MHHKYGFNTLSRSSAERKALLSNQANSLIISEQIITTKAKATETKKLVEKLITKAKRSAVLCAELTQKGEEAQAKAVNVHAHRQVARYLDTRRAVTKVFDELAPLFKDRQGGYTRIVKIAQRDNDAAQLVVLQFVEKTDKTASKSTEKKAKVAKEAKVKKADSAAKQDKNATNVKATKAQGAAQKSTRRKVGQ